MDLDHKQFVRVSVKSIKGEHFLEHHFSVDPRTITLDRLRHLVARVLDIRGEFSLLLRRSTGDEPVPLCCDWDLEGALSEESRIELSLQLSPGEPGLEEWDIICPADVPVAGHEASCRPRQRKESFLEQILNIRLTPSQDRHPITESDFKSLADWPRPLRYAVFRAGGVELHVRPALWMHLLDVYPSGAGHRDREEFLNRKAEEYYGLRHAWQKLEKSGSAPAVLRDITNLVQKDVRRTDRPIDLDERALYNVLTTYAVHHPSVGYCQGMSDLLSPLLHVMRTEARAYVALCGLMLRMKDNFRRDGRSVRVKFRHLRRALRAHDPQLHAHLRRTGALDLLFCYRWLLLDLKREFPYAEMLTFMEVAWATLRPLDLEKGVELFERRFPDADRPSHRKMNPPTFALFDSCGGGKGSKAFKRRHLMSPYRFFESSSTDEEEEGDVFYRTRPRRLRIVCRSWSGRDPSDNIRQRPNDDWLSDSADSAVGRRRHGSSDSNYGSNFSEEEEEEEAPFRGRSEGYTSGDPDETTPTDSDDEDSLSNAPPPRLLLPPPTRLFDGKPFLLFACLTMLLNQRDAILSAEMDAGEIGIHFDQLVRRHRLTDVLPIARELFAEYLRSGWTEDG